MCFCPTVYSSLVKYQAPEYSLLPPPPPPAPTGAPCKQSNKQEVLTWKTSHHALGTPSAFLAPVMICPRTLARAFLPLSPFFLGTACTHTSRKVTSLPATIGHAEAHASVVELNRSQGGNGDGQHTHVGALWGPPCPARALRDQPLPSPARRYNASLNITILLGAIPSTT